MAGITPYLAKALLDWALNGATPTRPSQLWVQWATASPTTQSAFDGPFSSRRTATFAAANSPNNSATLLAAVSGATASAAATVVGWNLYDASSGGNRLLFGTLSASLGCKSASDNPAFPAGGLVIVLS